MLDLTPKQWVKHVLTHPFEGYEDMRWKKAGSLKISFFVVFMLFVAQVAYNRLYGFQFYVAYDKIFNIVPYLVQSIVLFATWVIGNWAVCTLLDGEGSMKNICIYSAYALIPYVASSLIGTVLSHFLIRDEYIFIQVIEYVGILWSVVLMLSAMKAVHQYTITKTLGSIVLTFVAMLIILFLAVLLVTLFQQIYVFVYSIYTEIAYRIKM